MAASAILYMRAHYVVSELFLRKHIRNKYCSTSLYH